jgi:preprotein translocase subunit SecY
LAHLWRLVGWKRLAVTALCLVAWRALDQIPVAELNPKFMNHLLLFTNTSTFLHAIGSALPFDRYSIVVMGIGPYINALIIMSILPVMSQRMRTMRESPDGRLRLQLWTRALAIVLAFGQSYGWTVLMQMPTFPPQLDAMDWFSQLTLMLELTGGTMILVLLADTLDEFGLGFGNGAVLIYALTPLAGELHNLAQTFATTQLIAALYRPFAIWVGFSVAVVVATVMVVLAVRRLPGVESKKARSTKPIELKLLMSGVLRPPIFAQAVMFSPVIVANYYMASNPDLARWIYNAMNPYGPNPWIDLAYLAIYATLVIAFVYFVVAIDFGRNTLPRSLVAHIYRITLIGGAFLAVAVVLVPFLNHLATAAAGKVIPLSGFEAVLIVTMLVAIVGALERSGKNRGTQVLTSRLP